MTTTVATVMSRDLLTVEPHATLGTLARALRARNVSSALVVEDGALVGIITERDLVAAVAASRPPDIAEVGSWMSTDLVTVDADTAIADAYATMVEHHVRHLPVLDGAAPVGMLSIRDVSG